MNIGEIGNLHARETALPSLAARHPSAAFSDMVRAAVVTEGAAGGKVGIALDFGKPLGAAANSGAKDAEHAGRKTARIDRTDKLYEQCRELETFLIKNLLSGLRKTVEKSELSDGGFAGRMYEDMLWDKYAESMSRNAGLGLADQVYLELNGKR